MGTMEGTSCGYFLNHRFSSGEETQFGEARYSSGFGSGYQDRINKGQFAFPVDEDKLDGRLSAGEIVLIVEAGETGDSALAFPLGVIGDSAANADVGGERADGDGAGYGRYVQSGWQRRGDESGRASGADGRREAGRHGLCGRDYPRQHEEWAPRNSVLATGILF